MSSSKRHFTVVMNSNEHGLYVSSTPSSAARKVVSKLCADNKNKKVEFSLRETTKASNKKIYGPYTGYMQKLDKPIELKGRVIRYKPIAKLKKSLKKNNQIGGFLKVGDKVRIDHCIKMLLGNLKGIENIFIVTEIFPQISEHIIQLITIKHISGHPIIRVKINRVEKINNNSAASAAVENANIWKELSAQVQNEDKNDWFFIKNGDDWVKVKRSGNKNSYVKINNPESSNDNFEHISANKIDSSNSEWLEVSNPNHKAQNLNNT
jgi:hypothetical protein